MEDINLTALRDRPIFICGHPKAGTSLVRAILDSHPQLVVYPEETVFFRRYLPEASDLDLESQLDLAEQRLIHIFTWNRENPSPSQAGYPDRDYTAISFEEVRRVMHAFAQHNHRHVGDILSAAVLAFGQASGQIDTDTLYWVEKSPYNEYFAEKIFAWWPDAHCIHIVRDPRDNYVSYRRKHPDWRAEFFGANWKRSAQTGLKNQARFGEQRYRVIRYEDLTQSPETILRQLAIFLQITWDPSLTAPTRAGEQWVGNSMFANEFQGISAAPVARWKEKLHPQDAAVIEMIDRSLMGTLGYSPTPAHERPSSVSLSARWRVMTWSVRRRLTRLQESGTKREPSSA